MTPTLLDLILGLAVAAGILLVLLTKHERLGRTMTWIAGPALGLHIAVDLIRTPGLLAPAGATAPAAAGAVLLLVGLLAGVILAAMFTAMTKA